MEPRTSPTIPRAWLLVGSIGLAIHYILWDSVWTAWIGLLAYAPLLAWVLATPRPRFRHGLSFGMFHAVFNVWWLGQFVGRWTQNLIVGGLVVLAIGLIWGSIYGLTLVVSRRAFLNHPLALFLLLLGAEFSRCNLPQLEFPFAIIGEPLVVYGRVLSSQWVASALVVACSVLFAQLLVVRFQTSPATSPEASPEASSKPGQCSPTHSNLGAIGGPMGSWKVALLPVMLTLAYSMMNLTRSSPTTQRTPLNAEIIQFGVDMAYQESDFRQLGIDRAVAQAIRDASSGVSPDVMVFPEATLSCQSLPVAPATFWTPFDLILGIQYGDGPRFQGAMHVLKGAIDVSDKMNLVVFGESVPFRGNIPYPESFKLPAGDLAPGTARKIFRLQNGWKVGPLICFESLFRGAAQAQLNNGADILSIHSLDDWYAGTSAIPRLLTAARWRAIETNRNILRVSSLGGSCLISPSGEISGQPTQSGYSRIQMTITP